MMKKRNAKSFLKGSLFVSATLVALTLGSGIANAAPADNTTQTQGAVVNGVVRDANGEPIIGANIVEKGTNNGTITDVDGKFTLNIAKNATVVVSYVGMKEKEVRGAKNMIVNLQEDTEVLDELVVVGYGVQKKANLTGAVSSVDVSKTLEGKSETNFAKALQGAVPGLTITNSNGDINGEPKVEIRGIGSLNGSSRPLYVIDGVPMEQTGDFNPLSSVNANDIESVSVLKDAASTSIYGTRAAFGVILITTKTAKNQDKCKVSYSNNFGWSTATVLPYYPAVSDQMYAFVDAKNNFGTAAECFGMYLDSPHFQDMVLAWEKKYGKGYKKGHEEMIYGVDYDESGYYANYDYAGILFNRPAPSQQHNISVQGNAGKTQYYMSLGYDKKESLIQVNPDSKTRYNATINLSTQATDWLQVGARFNYTNTDFESVYTRGGSYQYLWRWGSFFPMGYVKLPGDDTMYDTRNTYGYRMQAGEKYNKKSNLRAGGFFKVDFLPSSIKNHKLSFNADYTYAQQYTEYKGVGLSPTLFNTWSLGKAEDLVYDFGSSTFVETDHSMYRNHVMNAYLNYSADFNNAHHLNVMVGGNLDKTQFEYLYYEMHGIQDPTMPELALSNDFYDYSHSKYHYGSAGFFGRINYDYKGIYLVELNGRYDMSSKFPAQSRGAFFPSFSLGYRISEEAYFEKAKEYVTNLKLRASYGTIGNQDIGANMFLETMSKKGQGVAWLGNGSSKLDYFTDPKLVAASLSWETIATTNIGIDFGFLRNTLNVSFDWFQRENKDMVAPGKAMPSVLGAAAAYENAGSMRTRGWELNADWRDTFGDWTIYANFNLSDYKTVITTWDSNNLINANYSGKTYGEIWGFRTDRYFESAADVASSPSQAALETGKFTYGPGDIKFQDINGDGKIDWGAGTPEDHGDLEVIGNTTPRFNYALRAGFNYAINKGQGGTLDFDAFFQGVGSRQFWQVGSFVIPMSREADCVLYGWQTDYITNAEVAAGTIRQDAEYPRMFPDGSARGAASSSILDLGAYNYYPQDKYLVNGAYLRLKNLTLGYTLPRTLTRKATIEKVRLYGTIDNVCNLVDHMSKYGLDPEINAGTGALSYGTWGRTEPIARTYSIGLQVEF